jgi:hypothetical protein
VEDGAGEGMTCGPWRSATAGGGGAAGGRGPAELGQMGREAALARAGLKGWRRPAAARVGLQRGLGLLAS